MNYNDYKLLFDGILNNSNPVAPYNDEAYMNYVRLNKSRMSRWDKQTLADEHLLTRLKQINQAQHWIIITEPWCGDAAHIVPFLVKMAEQNEKISYDIQLRDSEPFLIENYLTNGTKSIPKFIVRDTKGNDLLVWGPRPKEAQKVMDNMKTQQVYMDTIKLALQNWYNEDKGKTLCGELAESI